MSFILGRGWNPFQRHALGGIVEELHEPAIAPRMSKTKTGIPTIMNLNTSEMTKPKSETWATTVERVPSWPEEARPLKKRTWIQYLYGFADIILILLPVYFMCE
jgi:hypothetical protein